MNGHEFLILGILNGIILPAVFFLGRYTLSTRKILEDHKLYVAMNYIVKNDIEKRFNRIDNNLDKIWKKLDTLK